MKTLNAQNTATVAGGVIATKLPGDFPIIGLPLPLPTLPEPPYVTQLPYPLPPKAVLLPL